MKIRTVVFLLLLTIKVFSQERDTIKKFKLDIGTEYRLTPVEDISGNAYYMNISRNLSGVPVNFSIAYMLSSKWELGFQYNIRYDHVGVEVADNVAEDFAVYRSVNNLISDYKLFVQRNFLFKQDRGISLMLGYNWMNDGVYQAIFKNDKRTIYKYNFTAFNMEVKYFYKYFHMGVGIYYNPKPNFPKLNGGLNILYFNLGFDILKF